VTAAHISEIICASVHLNDKQNALRKIVINEHIVLEHFHSLFFRWQTLFYENKYWKKALDECENIFETRQKHIV
jgi:hypothetical protein